MYNAVFFSDLVVPRFSARFVLLIILDLYVVFFACLSLFCNLCLMLSVSVKYPFLISPLVFPNVYLSKKSVDI